MANNYGAWVRNQDVDIPDQADKLLFAVDLVHFVMAAKWPEYEGLPRNDNREEEYRHLVYNPFVGDIRDAVQQIVGKMADDIENRFLEYLENNDVIDENSFRRMAEEVVNELTVDGEELTMRNLLRYFVCLGLLAGHYYSNNVPQMRQVATYMIINRLPSEPFENADYWDELNATSRIILGIQEEPRPEDPPNLHAAEYQEHPSPERIPEEPFM